MPEAKSSVHLRKTGQESRPVSVFFSSVLVLLCYKLRQDCIVGRASAGTTRGEPSQVSETGPAEGHISRILEISQLLANTATSEMGFWRACGRFQSASPSFIYTASRPIEIGRRLKPAPHDGCRQQC